MKRIGLGAVLGCALLLFPLSSMARTDFQSWNNFTLMGPINGNVRYWFDGQIRIGNDASRLSQSIARPGIGYQLNKESSLWAGYAWIYTARPFTPIVVHEHRTWQQFLWVKDIAPFKVFSRTRLEQRFIENVPRTGWRVRQFFRAQLPISEQHSFFVSAIDEVFVRINNSRPFGNDRGFDQNRLFLGVGFLPAKHWLAELGYQNQYIRRVGISNFRGNYVMLTVIGNY